ncbi:MAG: preprotein translocase subunit SecG [Bacteroidales bacterium]|jgi:preprotein translocase subunit SecG|nr:preprotein translocase subunit SecG [Bacteroidales bacterium]
MYSVISTLIVIACVFLILIVLVQNSKGGGLAANFSSSNQILGVRKTADFLEKATWTLAGSLVVLCMMAAIMVTSSRLTDTGSGSILDSQVENAVDPGTIPSFPTTTTPVLPTEGQPEQPVE